MDATTLEIVTPRALSSVRLVDDVLFVFCQHLQKKRSLDELFPHNMKLVVAEALTNSVKHTQAPPDVPDVIHIRVVWQNDWLEITVIDYGEGVDLDHISEPDDDIENESGRGLFIIESLVDDVVVRKENGRNFLVMRKKLV